ncbi:alpha/beta hydrolase fold domain-containing protein [Streptomyces fradiae]|uniref:alpha/beta hydrolase fold domain-containing protein n=1 Tax=Streptomyces fradiae TaxID=1906 RepID=UPI003518B25B
MTQQTPPQADMTWPPPAFLPPPAPVVTADGCRRFEGATYATTPGYRPRLLDVYVPAGHDADDRTNGPCPAVVWIHGGGWMDGDRRYPPPTVPAELLFGTLLGAGLAVVTLDYRHSLEAPFPAQLHDVKAAIRYVRAFADTLGIDADRIGVWGESAGGHLAALAALTGPGTADGLLEGAEGVAEGDTSVQAAVDWYGVSDIVSAAAAIPPQLAPLGDPYTALLGAAPADRPDLAAAASPVTYATRPAPPFLLVHGTADSLVPYGQSELLTEQLRAQGGVVELVPVDGADHIFLGVPDIPALVTRSVSFLADRLKAHAAR